MSLKVTSKELESIISLNSMERYKYALKRIADWEEVWGLYDNGWALAGDDEANQYFLIWPAEKYAEICALNEWRTYKTKNINIYYFLDNILGKLETSGINLAVFLTPDDDAVILSLDEFKAHLTVELTKYE